MKNLSKIFLTGLATALPVVATVYLVVWLAVTSESFLGAALRFVLPNALYRPGLGVAAGVALVLLIGLVMRTWAAKKLFSWAEAFLYRLPLVKSIYGALRDFFTFFSEAREKEFQQVVVVRLGATDMRLVGFVTRSDLASYPPGLGERDTIAVYVPMSYQIGGYTLLVPRAAVQPVKLSFQEAMRFALTAGVGRVLAALLRSEPMAVHGLTPGCSRVVPLGRSLRPA